MSLQTSSNSSGVMSAKSRCAEQLVRAEAERRLVLARVAGLVRPLRLGAAPSSRSDVTSVP